MNDVVSLFVIEVGGGTAAGLAVAALGLRWRCQEARAAVEQAAARYWSPLADDEATRPVRWTGSVAAPHLSVPWRPDGGA